MSLFAILRYFLPVHIAVTALLFLLQFIRRKDESGENVLLPPPLYWTATVCALIFIFPFLPYYVKGEWNEAYYIMIPSAASMNICRLLFLNWRVEVGEDTAITRDMFGIKKEFVLKESELKKSLFRSHTLCDGKKRFNIPNDTQNYGYLVRKIRRANKD